VETNLIDIVVETLDYQAGIIRPSDVESIQGKPLKKNLAKQSFELIKDIDAIYFSGEHPLIYFKSFNAFINRDVKDLQKKVWNQGRVPLLFITTPKEIRIYNCYKEPLKENDDNIDTLEIDRFSNAVNELDRLKLTYDQSQVDSGLFWETVAGKKIHTSKKVDQLLLTNLREARKRLYALMPKKKSDNLPIIHNLLGRSLFILYLEDRNVITPSYYTEFLSDTNSYFQLLRNKRAAYTLYQALNEKFNGDLFTISKSEAESVKQEHLEIIRECFYGDTDLKSRQLFLWRVFDFSFIPIELISSIYEEFLHVEEGEDEISSQGAYYTPLPLVEFVLNEVLPFPDENNFRYDLKLIDPACGSGIFLVEAYRRLIERWKYVNGQQRISVEDLRTILRSSIFGIEKNNEAIKVASFSLYLTILNYLEPKSIWTKVKFPLLINSPNKEDDKQGFNLIHGDTFETENHFNIDFDLVIGNPPWKRGNLSETLTSYITKHSLAKEAVLPFLHKMAHIAPNAKIALVSAAKILFNASSGYENFRQFLFNETKVDCIVNFSALRKSKGEIGRKLFTSATGPTIVIFYSGINIKERNPSIVYCVPKPQFRDTALGELIIDSSDIKFIPITEASNPKSTIWKVAMWGTFRDLKLIKKVSRTDSLLKILDSEVTTKWYHGGGFRTTQPTKHTTNVLKRIPFLAAGNIELYYTNKDKTTRIHDVNFERLGQKNTYKAPHIVIKEGQTKKRFCASFLDYDCTFKSNTYGIVGNVHPDILKSITAYLNSSFATYYLFLSLSSWGIERERVEFNQMLSIPAFEFLFDKVFSRNIAREVNKIIRLKREFTLGSEQQISQIEREIDTLILQAIGLSKNDRSLIENTVEYSLDFFQEGSKSKAILPVISKELEKYAGKICRNLDKILEGADTKFWAKIYEASSASPLVMVSIHFDHTHDTGKILRDESDVMNILHTLNRNIYEQHSESIYFRKVVKYYDNDVLFIVKPNEKRFWTEAIALEDSDAIAIEMVTADTNLNE